MNEKITAFNEYLTTEAGSVRLQIDALVADDRADEARPLRAAFNIYDIFGTLANTALTKSKGDSTVFRLEFHKLAERIPSSWKKSLETAKEFGDFEKVLIEEAKLNAAEMIIKKFDEMF